MEQGNRSREELIEENEFLKKELRKVRLENQLNYKYRELVDSLGEIVLIAQDGRLALGNKKAEEIFGKPIGELSKIPFTEYIHPDDRELVLDNYIKRMSDPTYHKTYPFRILTDDGNSNWVKISAVQIEWQGRPATLNILTDIHERVSMEEELQRAKAVAEEAAQKEARFLANMSHEIRTPMNGVLGMTHLLLDTSVNETQKHYLTTIEQSSQYLLRVINDILDYSSIEAGKMSIFAEPFHLPDMLSQLKNSFTHWATDKGLLFTCNFADSLPQSVSGDQTRISQILTNLLSNAIKFTNEGEITFSVSYSNRSLQLHISDTGVGIPQEKQQQIFDSFAQVNSAETRHIEGTGLGLAITKQLVNLMNGTIHFTSEKGKGTTFFVTLPIREADSSGYIQKQLPTDTSYNSHILVVEDNDVNYLVVQKFLEKLGCTTNRAPDGFSAIEMAENNKYHLIFMDIQMPGIDGYETTRRIRDVEKSEGTNPIPIIAMTANAMQSDEKRCIEAGMDQYISKPIEFHKLLALLGDVLQPEELIV